MCGRFTLSRPAADVAAAFEVDQVPLIEPRYNVAPTQGVLAVRGCGEGREGVVLRWGFALRSGAKGPPLINAMAETAAQKPTFRAALAGRRCLVPADGFFEWRTDGRERKPYLFRVGEGELFAFAGLWQPWANEDWAGAVCVLTVGANELLRGTHDRMPAILARADYGAWLDPDLDDLEALAEMLRPYPAEQMTAHAVSSAVNNARNEGPQCVEPDEGPAQGSLF